MFGETATVAFLDIADLVQGLVLRKYARALASLMVMDANGYSAVTVSTDHALNRQPCPGSRKCAEKVLATDTFQRIDLALWNIVR